jgi:hypothetical protein
MDKFKQAIAEYTREIELHPDDANAYYNRGVAKVMTGDKKGAYIDWQKAAEGGHPKAKELIAAHK